MNYIKNILNDKLFINVKLDLHKMDIITNVFQFSEEIETLVNQNGLNDLDCENVKFLFPISNEGYLVELEKRIKSDVLYRNLLVNKLYNY